MADDFAKDVRELFTQAEEADKTNREEAVKDLKFAAGEQWNETVRSHRETTTKDRPFPLPCLTVNTLPQFVGQVIGDRRANATSIKVLPREDGDKEVAQVRSELIRSIELQSKADRVYTMAFEQAVTCGQGNFRVDMDWAREDAFERDLFIRAIPNPMAVLWDPLSGDPTGRDAGHCFVVDRIHEKEYKKRFGEAADIKSFDLDAKNTGWVEDDTVRIAEFHETFEKPRTIAMMQDGKVVDVTEMPLADWQQFVARKADGSPIIREKAMCKYARMTLTNGQEPLSDPLELKLHRLPIIRVTGREIWIEDKRVRFGIVRFARDPQRLKNYYRSVRAELLMTAPRHNFIASESAIKGREADYVNALKYNDNAQPPVETTRNNLAALLAEEQMLDQDMRNTTGIHEADLGQQGNETSGIAIQRRQAQGDLATICYHDNMNAAQQEAGEVCDALIPIVYDTARTIRTVGADDAVKLLRVNDPEAAGNPQYPQDKNIDLSTGRYDVTITTGPSYQTRRVESTAQLMELASRAPQIAEAAGDLIIKEMDLVRSDEIAERIKRTIPANILGDDKDEDNDPQAVQAKEEAKQKQAAMERLQFEGLQADTKLKVAQAQKAEAEAMKAQAEAQQAMMGEGPDPLAVQKIKIDGYNAETNRIKAITAKDFPLPPEAIALLAPLVTQAVMQALGSPDVLPGELHNEIAESAFDDAANQRNNDLEDEEARADINREPERPGAEL